MQLGQLRTSLVHCDLVIHLCSWDSWEHHWFIITWSSICAAGAAENIIGWLWPGHPSVQLGQLRTSLVHYDLVIHLRSWDSWEHHWLIVTWSSNCAARTAENIIGWLWPGHPTVQLGQLKTSLVHCDLVIHLCSWDSWEHHWFIVTWSSNCAARTAENIIGSLWPGHPSVQLGQLRTSLVHCDLVIQLCS